MWSLFRDRDRGLVQRPLHSNDWCALCSWPSVNPSLSVLWGHSFLGKKCKRVAWLVREGAYVRVWYLLKIWGPEAHQSRKVDPSKQNSSGWGCSTSPGHLGLNSCMFCPDRQWPWEPGQRQELKKRGKMSSSWGPVLGMSSGLRGRVLFGDKAF